MEHWDSEVDLLRVETCAVLFVITEGITSPRLPSTNQTTFNQTRGLVFYYVLCVERRESRDGYLLAYSVYGVLSVCDVSCEADVEDSEDECECSGASHALAYLLS